ncbi:hypothetical protein ABBQ32_004460 [Trebouxia sp. C0010 RCD-2024]
MVFPHTSLNTTVERHFGEVIKAYIVEEIQVVQTELKIQVKAVVTDAASDCRKARRLFVKEYPHIVSLDCFAHQMNLSVGDYLKHHSGAADELGRPLSSSTGGGGTWYPSLGCKLR